MRFSLLIISAMVSIATAYPVHNAREVEDRSLSATETVKEARAVEVRIDARSLGDRLSGLSNAERIQRGLPPKAPKRRFDGTQTAQKRGPSAR